MSCPGKLCCNKESFYPSRVLWGRGEGLPLTLNYDPTSPHFSHVWLCETLWMDYSVPDSCPWNSPRDLSNPGMEPTSLTSPVLAGGFFTTSATWKALVKQIKGLNVLSGKSISYATRFLPCFGLEWVSFVVQQVKNPPAMQETWVQSLGWEDTLKKRKATRSSILAMGSHRVRHNWTTFTFTWFRH